MRKFFSIALTVLFATAMFGTTVNADVVNVIVGPGGSFVFSPADISINVGDTVRWTWVSGGHNVGSGLPGIPTPYFLSGPPAPSGTTFEVVFDETFLKANPEPGNFYDYHCHPHGGFGMIGSIQVIVPPATVGPETVTPTRGDYVSGGVAELTDSDNSDYSMRRRNADTQSRTEFELKGTSPTETPSSFEVTLEGAVFARSNVVQTIELFDYVLNDWELVDCRIATRLVDSTANIVLAGNLSRFVEAGTGCIEARIHYQSVSPRENFASNTDQFVWTIGQ